MAFHRNLDVNRRSGAGSWRHSKPSPTSVAFDGNWLQLPGIQSQPDEDVLHLIEIPDVNVAVGARHRQASAVRTPRQPPDGAVLTGQGVERPDVSGPTNGCHRNIGSAKGDQFVCLPMGILSGGVTLQARRPLTFQVFNPLTGAVVSNLTLIAENRFALPQGPGAHILKGRLLEVTPPAYPSR